MYLCKLFSLFTSRTSCACPHAPAYPLVAHISSYASSHPSVQRHVLAYPHAPLRTRTRDHATPRTKGTGDEERGRGVFGGGAADGQEVRDCHRCLHPHSSLSARYVTRTSCLSILCHPLLQLQVVHIAEPDFSKLMSRSQVLSF